MSNDQTQATLTGDDGDDSSPQATADDIDNRHDDLDVDDFGNELGDYDTKGGYNKYEVTSSLQKAVRRSDPELAAFCAWELVRSGYEWNYWQRVATIANEDLSLTDNSNALPTCMWLFELAHGHDPVNYWGKGTHQGRARFCAMKAAVVLARAESSRETDFMEAVFRQMRDERINAELQDREIDDELEMPELPDVSRDMHTYQGKKMDRGYDHFLIHSSRVSNMTEVEKKYKQLEMRNNDPGYEFGRSEYDHALSATEDEEPYDEPSYRS